MPSSLAVVNRARAVALKNKPLLKVNQTVAQTVSTATNTTITFTTTVVDNYAGWNGTTTYTVKVAGVYRVNCSIHWTTNGTGMRFTQLRKNGTADLRFQFNTLPTAAGALSCPIVGTIRCVVGDTITIVVDQESGGNLATMASGNYLSSLMMEWLSR